MLSLLDLVQSPTAIKLTPNFYSANNLAPNNINSYNQSKHNLQQHHHRHHHDKHKRHSSSRHKKVSSRLSANQQFLLSKNTISRAKSSQTNGGKSHSHKSQLKKKHHHHNKKSPKQDYKVQQMYLSKVSQMASEISMPSYSQKISFNQLNELENRIMAEILQLRQQKISALEGLNSVVDEKNRAVEILRKLEVMREMERLNGGENQKGMEEQLQYERNNIIKGIDNNNSISKISYLQGRTPLNRLIKSSTPTRKQINRPISNSSFSSPQQQQLHQSHTALLINSKLSQEVQQKDDAVAEVKRIKQQLMKPLLNQHPLLVKNSQLKHQLQQLQQQLTSLMQSPKQNFQQQLEHCSQQNLLLKKQIERQQQKLTSLESKRLATFFPKDRENVERMRRLMGVERELQERREQLLEEERILREDGEISNVRSKQEEGIITSLKQENRQLQLNCDQLMSSSAMISTCSSSQYFTMAVQQLENLVYRQQQSKHTLQQLLTQFKGMIGQLEDENNRLRQKQQSGFGSYYNGGENSSSKWSPAYYNFGTEGYYNSNKINTSYNNYNYNSHTYDTQNYY